ncbi:ATP-dependent Clp protease subunit B [Actinobacillus equuli]|nr:ATP-dependent Clp protease subunit B [Actinobacillus equuli]
MSELQYGKIPALEKQLAEAVKREEEGGENQLLRTKVTDEELQKYFLKRPVFRFPK